MKLVAVQRLQFDKWSPELISVRGNETGLCPVSLECLYQWIWAFKHRNKRAHQPFKREIVPKTCAMGIEGVKEASDAILGVLSPVASP
jgi:hypothetical protein